MIAREHKEKIYSANKQYFDLADELAVMAHALLLEFNSRSIRLNELPPHKRISLFFLARSIKTYTAAVALCREGFGQDVMLLLRSLLENLVSLKYILVDPKIASEKTLRFVDYKWVIFKRNLSEGQEAEAEIRKQYDAFKERYRVISDKALLTWSGRSVRDMAGIVGKDLLREYDANFRLCSRFSHPGIIGDREYIDYTDEAMEFSFLPSGFGISSSLVAASRYVADLLSVFDGLFGLGFEAKFDEHRRKIALMASSQRDEGGSPPGGSGAAAKKNPLVKFKF